MSKVRITVTTAGRPSGPGGGDPADAGHPIPRLSCEMCEWARQCGAKVWECDACGLRRDFRAHGQFALFRDDDEPNLDRRENGR